MRRRSDGRLSIDDASGVLTVEVPQNVYEDCVMLLTAMTAVLWAGWTQQYIQAAQRAGEQAPPPKLLDALGVTRLELGARPLPESDSLLRR